MYKKSAGTFYTSVGFFLILPPRARGLPLMGGRFACRLPGSLLASLGPQDSWPWSCRRACSIAAPVLPLSASKVLLQLRVPAPAEQPGGGPAVPHLSPPHGPASAPDTATGEPAPGPCPEAPWAPCVGPPHIPPPSWLPSPGEGENLHIHWVPLCDNPANRHYHQPHHMEEKT